MSALAMVIIVGGVLLTLLGYACKDWSILFNGILFMVAGMFIGIGAVDGIGIMTFGWIIFMAAVIMLIILHKQGKEEDKKRLQEEEQIKKIEMEQAEKETAKSIYKACKRRKIEKFNSEETKQTLRLIAQNYDVEDLEKAKALYETGKRLVAQDEEDEERRKLQCLRKEDMETYNKQQDLIKIVGKDKYIKACVEEYNRYTSALQASAKMKPLIKQQQFYHAPKHDAAIWGGLASGLAGGAAGLATAVNTELENAQAQEDAKQIREDAREQLKTIRESEITLKKSILADERKIEKFKNKLYDENDIYKKFKLLKFSDWNVTVRKSGNLNVKATISVDEPIALCGQKAALDGSIKIAVKDSEKREIGHCYYSAPGFNQTDISKVGFKSGKKVSALCVVNNYDSIKKDDTYTCEVEPINLWMIEQ